MSSNNKLGFPSNASNQSLIKTDSSPGFINWLSNKDNFIKIGVSVVCGLSVVGIGYYFFYQSANNKKGNTKKPAEKANKYNELFDKWPQNLKQLILSNTPEAIQRDYSEQDRKIIGETLKDHGNALFRKQDYKEATEIYSKAIEYNPKNCFYYSNRAACYTNLELYEKAIEDSTMSLMINSKFTKGYLRRASAYEKTNKHKEAINDYMEALKISKFGDKTAMLGVQKTIEKQSELEAIEIMQNDTKWNEDKIRLPGVTTVKVFMDGYEYGSFEGYLQEFPSLDQTENKNYEAFKHAIEVFKNENYEKAFELLNEYLRNEDSRGDRKRYALALDLRGTLYMLAKMYEEAKQDFNSAKSYDSSYIMPYLKMSALLMELEKTQEALAELDNAQDIDKNSHEVHYYRGQVLMLAQNYNEAIQEYTKAIELNKDFYLAYIQKGAVEFRNNDVSTADRTYELLITKFSDNAKVNNYYAEYLIAKQDISQSQKIIQYLNKAMELDPRMVLPMINMGVVKAHYEQKYDEAIAVLKKALEIDESCDVAYQTLYYIYYQQQNKQKAMEMLDESIRNARTKEELTTRITHKHSMVLEQECMSQYPN